MPASLTEPLPNLGSTSLATNSERPLAPALSKGHPKRLKKTTMVGLLANYSDPE